LFFNHRIIGDRYENACLSPYLTICGLAVTSSLTLDLKIYISSSLSPVERICKFDEISHKRFISYRINKRSVYDRARTRTNVPTALKQKASSTVLTATEV